MARSLARLLVPVLAAGILLFATDAPRGNLPSAILVELFTSEGCSSCPPADALLQQLDASQPVSGAQLIVLSKHVDYWNHIGWTDPYSSWFFTDRQSAYAERFGLNSAYTPQMVVDGRTEFVGNDAHRVNQAIQESLAQQKVEVRISRVSLLAPHTLQAHIEADALPEPSKARHADVYIVVALNHAESQVLRGENGGRRLTHVGVVQSLTKIGSLELGKGFSRDVRVKLDSKTDLTNLRAIAFVQQPTQREVLGAAMEKVK